MSAVNEELAALFEDMAQLLERKGDLIFKIRAYQRAAEIISNFSDPLDALTQQGQDLTKVAGIGKAISGKICEYITTGQVAAYERLKAEFPGHEGVSGGFIIDCTNYHNARDAKLSRFADKPESDSGSRKRGQAN